ncbi:MAG: hypothetical protein ACREQC_03240 [Candidatus Binataceae bacterium]
MDLFGIVKDDVKGTRAVVRASPNSKIVLVRVGDNIDGWKVSQIDVRKLVLSLGERSTAFTLFSGKSATPNVTPVRRPPTVLDLAAIGRRLQQAAYRRR